MEHIQDDSIKMISATYGCLIKNKPTWLTNATMASFTAELKTSTDYLKAQQVIQVTGSKDETKTKLKDRELLIKPLIKVKSGIIAYANAKQDFTIFNSIKKSNSDIEALADDELVAYATIVYNAAVVLETPLILFNIIADDTTAVKTRLDIFDDDLNKHRIQQAAVVVATANIDKELTRIKAKLKLEIDPLVETYLDIAPDFVNQYKSSRKIIHFGVHHKKAEATVNLKVTDAITGEDLYLVNVLIVETGEATQTNIDGTDVLQFAKAGVYTITCKKPAYQIHTQNNVELGVGDVLNLNISLKLIVAPIPPDPIIEPEK
ncbi:MAG: carboxypeptidase-like regulatory domain-containing protein [Bacteroidota bacterium]